eukprot:7390282-Prymnesium_polylepis.3
MTVLLVVGRPVLNRPHHARNAPPAPPESRVQAYRKTDSGPRDVRCDASGMSTPRVHGTRSVCAAAGCAA